MRVAATRAARGLLVAGSLVAIAGLEPVADPPGPLSAGVVPPAADAIMKSSSEPTVPARAVTSPPQPAPPIRLRVRSLRIDALVVPVTGESAGELAVPDDPRVVGWWRDSALPGSDRGTVVLDGHVDTRANGPGALFRLATLRPGDVVFLMTGAGAISYDVRAVRRYPKSSLPVEVFDRSGAPRLVLISCGGRFNRASGHYADNVVVYTVPTGPRRGLGPRSRPTSRSSPCITAPACWTALFCAIVSRRNSAGYPFGTDLVNF